MKEVEKVDEVGEMGIKIVHYHGPLTVMEPMLGGLNQSAQLVLCKTVSTCENCLKTASRRFELVIVGGLGHCALLSQASTWLAI